MKYENLVRVMLQQTPTSNAHEIFCFCLFLTGEQKSFCFPPSSFHRVVVNTGGNMGWSFQEQISCQILDVTKPWRATPGHEHRFKGSFPWKHRVHYVPFKFSKNALNSKWCKIIQYQDYLVPMLWIQNVGRLFSTRNLSQPTLW